jgi:type IV pilus assembly protein PilQ
MSEITISRLIKLKHIMAQGVIEMIPEGMASKAVLKLARDHNGVMVTGPVQVVDGIEKYLAELDIPPAQILIEALVVDYNITDRKKYGVQAACFPLMDSSRQGQSYYPDIDVTGSSEELNRDIRHWADKFGMAGVGTLPEEFFVRLNALAREGKANVRSRPRIATLNGHEARIDVGTTQYYLLKTETTYGVGQQTPTSQVTEKFQTVEASMSLTITPWVNASNEILVTIHPEFNTPEGSFSSSVPPTINHRILDSNVRLHDGETIILGGLIQTSENETVEKFPILGDIPVLGWFFKNKSKIKTNSELVIYLTPHIYYGNEGAVDISKLEK